MAIEHSLLIKGNMVSLDKIIQYCQGKGNGILQNYRSENV